MSEAFYKLPSWLLSAKGLSIEAKVLLARLSHFEDHESGFLKTTVASLADEFDLSARTIRRALAELRDAGFVQSEHGKWGESYRTLPRSSWPKVIGMENSSWPKMTGLMTKSDRDKTSASLLGARDIEIAAASGGNGKFAAAAFPDSDLEELANAIATTTGERPDERLVKRITRLVEKASGDSSSALAFARSKRRRRFDGNGVWVTLFQEDYPGWLERNRPAKVEQRTESEPELSAAELAAKAEHEAMKRKGRELIKEIQDNAKSHR